MYRLRYAERKAYTVLCTSGPGCVFLFVRTFFAASMLPYAPVGVLFVFHGKSPEYKTSAYGKENFYYEHEHDHSTFFTTK